MDVVSSYIKLEKAGSNYKARCPFHNEKTPSFMVSPSRETFHCFGCNTGGDIFSFVQQIEGSTFPEALETLAERAGVELKKVKPGEQSDRKRTLQILDSATHYYHAVLKKNNQALEYLHKRGLTDETIENFRLGLAPEAWSSLYDFFQKKGANGPDLEKAGLVIRSGKNKSGWYDRFRARIMFPIFDGQGKVVGFSARIFGNEDSRQNEGKYINSPQSAVYDKSKVLYGFDKAKQEIRKEDSCILVEGQMDLLLSHQAGFTNTVASSGTALTEKSLTQIERLTQNLIMAFDADGAGVEASKRAVNMALLMGMEVKIAALPAGSDPADLILKDPDEWKKVVSSSKHVIDFYLENLSQKEPDKRLLARLIKEEVYPFIKKLAHRTDQSYFISKASQLVDVPEEIIWEDIRSLKTESAPVSKNQPAPVKTRIQVISEELFGLVFYLEHQKEKDKADSITGQIKEFLKDDFDKFYEKYNAKRDELSLKAEMFYRPENHDSLAEELLKQFKIEHLKVDLTETLKLLKQAENGGDPNLVDNLIKKCQYISGELNQINL